MGNYLAKIPNLQMDFNLLLFAFHRNNNLYSVGMNTRGQTGHDITIPKIDKFTTISYT